jgi:predicted enzyme related to lactoylglutathione lyase
MTAKATYSTPLLHVAEIEKSIPFYELLGFAVIDTEGKPMGWARLHCESGSIMFLRAEKPLDPSKQGFLFYLYTPDLAALREHLLANGIKVPAITYPEYMPSGKINLIDPDGYRVEIAQWGQAEQKDWEKRLSAKQQPRQ